jgi:nitroimidazol reductase NimA-like FMN-containing flavoprotein (pyridoxamine 5'-phosphate oxidase superfamily)
MTRMTELTLDECLRLLRTKRLGRIGLSTPAGLRILPVNYVLHQAAIVFRTLPYGVIANSAHGAQVAFEVDDVDEDLQSGWSVLASGPCRRIEDPAEVRLVREEDDPTPWAEGLRNLYFRLQWEDLTGRQVGETIRPTVRSARAEP